jgi:hypothetical protein
MPSSSADIGQRLVRFHDEACQPVAGMTFGGSSSTSGTVIGTGPA